MGVVRKECADTPVHIHRAGNAREHRVLTLSAPHPLGLGGQRRFEGEDFRIGDHRGIVRRCVDAPHEGNVQGLRQFTQFAHARSPSARCFPVHQGTPSRAEVQGLRSVRLAARRHAVGLESISLSKRAPLRKTSSKTVTDAGEAFPLRCWGVETRQASPAACVEEPALASGPVHKETDPGQSEGEA